MIGQTISHYRIVEKLGEGGMGVVYKAEDTKLRRTVALKFLRGDVLESGEHKERFLREAQAAAALDHPNICTVHEIDEAAGKTFLAMAFVEGQSVKDKIAERPLKLEEALDIAIQTAQGLQAAHEKGVVHRDIKPANLIVNAQGQVKIMDFGLAQLTDRTRLTQTSTLLGTPAYMSPEQAQRLPADRRTDIWSLGAVLYEMATGRLPFEGDREAAVLHAIIHEDHEPITALPLAALGQGTENPAISLRGNRLAYEVVSNDSNIWRYFLPAGKGGAQPLQLIGSTRAEMESRISPDGNRIAFSSTRSGKREIWICDRDGSNPLRLTSFEADCGSPRWSGDGRRIVFDCNVRGNWDVFVVSAEGGSPRVLTQHEGEDSRPSWSRDGRWVYFGSDRSGSFQAWKVSPEGGDPVQVTQTGGYGPVESPDGRFVYFSKEFGLWRMLVEGGKEAAVLPERRVGSRWDVAGNGVYFVELKADPWPMPPRTNPHIVGG
ncbi:MAG: protein kinase [Bryobacterales bacterium]